MKKIIVPEPVIRRAVGIWVRVSTEIQAQGDSPEHHEQRARFYAASKEWDVREIYRLEAVSGKSVFHHPECQRMLKDIKRGQISGLIFSKLARLARNTRELLEFSDLFRQHNADLISLQESIDTSTPAGRLFYTMIAAMAQWEREEIRDRVAVSIPIRAKLGKPINGKAPLGYQWVNKKLVLHPEEAPVRKLMYELFAEHKRLKTVARLLNESGHRTKGKKLFVDTTVHRLIQDSTAKGEHRSNYTTGSPKVLKPRDEWVINKVEPLVSEELWQQCNDLLDERHAVRPRRPSKKVVHLFAGFAVCNCGGKMYVPSNTPKYVCAACRTKIPITDLEGIYREHLKGYFISPTEVARHLAKSSETIAEKERLLEIQQKDLGKLLEEMNQVYALYRDRQISTEGFGKLYRPLEERQQQLEEAIPKLQADIDFQKINVVSTDEVVSEARDLYSRWPHMEHDAKRRAIESITDQIVIGKDDITIKLCYINSSEEMTNRLRKL